MRQRWGPRASEAGQATFSLLIVLAVVAVAVILLQRTASTADAINTKAGHISSSAGGINTSTAAVLKLGRTVELAGSILESAKPLQSKLDDAIKVAKAIDVLAASINDTAGTINNTAKGINGTAATILGTARSINAGVAQINRNLDVTIDLANQIKADTGNLLPVASSIHRNAGACIDDEANALGPGSRPPGECR